MTEAELFARMDRQPMTGQDGWYLVSFEAMGTVNRLQFAAGSRAQAVAFRARVLRWLARFEARYSAFIPDSLLMRLNRDACESWAATDAETDELFALCDWLYWKTGGVLDPTMGPLIALWNHHVPRAAVPDAQAIEDARRQVGWRHVERRAGAVRFARPGMRLDLGGMGKEFAVDRVLALAERHNITNVLIDLGHDVRAHGSPPEGGPWRVGLENPGAPGQCWGGVALRNEALCGSGNYLRFLEIDGERFGHILDPRTGWPVKNGCSAAWVMAPSATTAGALSTAAMILGPDEGLKVIEGTYEAAGCLWCGDKIHQTRRFENHVLQDEPVRV